MSTWLKGTYQSTPQTPTQDPVAAIAGLIRGISHRDMRRLSEMMSNIAHENVGHKLMSDETEYITDYDMQEILHEFSNLDFSAE